MSGNCLLRPVSQACSYRSYRRILLESCLTFGLESHPSSGVRQGTMINLKGVGSYKLLPLFLCVLLCFCHEAVD